MGSSSSSRIIKVVEARKRLGANLERCLKQYRIISGEDKYLRKNDNRRQRQQESTVPLVTFRRRFVEPIFPSMPDILSKILFRSFDSDSSRDVDRDEYLCGLAILMHGSFKEQIQFLFNGFDADRSGSLVARNLISLVKHVNLPDKPPRDLLYYIDELADESYDRDISLSSFAEIANKFKSNIFFRWFFKFAYFLKNKMDPGAKPAIQRSMQQVRSKWRPTSVSTFGRNAAQVRSLFRMYENMRKVSPSGVVDEASMRLVLSPPAGLLSPDLVRWMVRSFSGGSLSDTAALSPRQFLEGLSHFFYDERSTKCGRRHLIEAILRIFDTRGVGSVRRSHARAARDALRPQLTEDVFEAFEASEKKSVLDVTCLTDGLTNVDRLAEIYTIAHVHFGVRPHTGKMEHAVVRDCFRASWAAQRQIDVGTVTEAFLVTSDWWSLWCAFTSFPRDRSGLRDDDDDDAGKKDDPISSSPSPPPAIDNTRLLSQEEDESDSRSKKTLTLKAGIKEDVDFVALPALVWKALAEWYDGGPAISRRVVSVGGAGSYGVGAIDLYPRSYSIVVETIGRIPVAGQNHVRVTTTIQLSEFATLRDVRAIGCALVGILDAEVLSASRVRVESLENERLGGKKTSSDCNIDVRTLSGSSNDALDRQLRMLNVTTHERFVVAIPVISSDAYAKIVAATREHDLSSSSQSKDGTAVVAKSTTAPADASPSTYSPHKKVKVGTSHVNGVVGLRNLGNTCYMNSSLQCLSNTKLLREYFTTASSRWTSDLNDGSVAHRCGMAGKMAIGLARLMQVMWDPSNAGTCIQPTSFKRLLGHYRGRFRGYDQQDAQEMLQHLLGCVHEDLNRIAVRPHVDMPDSNGRPDSLVAHETWKNHLRRDMSIISALFFGQFKSLLVCTVCGHESATFNPFSILPVPLPETGPRFVNVKLWFGFVSSRDRYGIRYDATPGPLNVTLRVSRRNLDDYTVETITDALEGLAIEVPGVANVHEDEGDSRAGPIFVKAADCVVADVAPGAYIERIYIDPSTRLKIYGTNAPIHVFHLPAASELVNASADDGSEDDEAKTCVAVDKSGARLFAAGENVQVNIRGKRLMYPGASVRAKYAGNGKMYPATLVEVRKDSGTCTVKWQDGDAKHREVSANDVVTKYEKSKIDIWKSAVVVGRVVEGDDGDDEDAAKSREEVESTVREWAGEGPAVYEVILKPKSLDIRVRFPEVQRVRTAVPSQALESEGGATEGGFEREDAGGEKKEDSDDEDCAKKNGKLGEKKTDESLIRRIRVPIPKSQYALFVQRRLTTSSGLCGQNVTPFGAPVVLKLRSGSMTSKDLYDVVFRSMRKYVADWDPMVLPRDGDDVDESSSTRVFLPNEEDGGVSKKISIDAEMRAILRSYPFRLRCVIVCGKACSMCDWMTSCSGCLILPDSNCKLEWLQEDETIAVDWIPSLFLPDSTLRYNDRIDRLSQDHASVREYSKHASDPDAIEDCLRSFTKSEYVSTYCKRCTKRDLDKDFVESKKKKSIYLWGLPSILIFQLKRFKTVKRTGRFRRGTYSYKLNNFVRFPIDGLDLGSFVAKEMHADADAEGYGDGDVDETEKKKPRKEPANAEERERRRLLRELEKETDVLMKEIPATLSRSNTKYDLYAVCNHRGAIGGGHYYAYAKSSVDGRWRVYNDRKVYVMERPTEEVVTKYAYLLFYRRRDLSRTPLRAIYPAAPRTIPRFASPRNVDDVLKAKWNKPKESAKSDSTWGGFSLEESTPCSVM